MGVRGFQFTWSIQSLAYPSTEAPVPHLLSQKMRARAFGVLPQAGCGIVFSEVTLAVTPSPRAGLGVQTRQGKRDARTALLGTGPGLWGLKTHILTIGP